MTWNIPFVYSLFCTEHVYLNFLNIRTASHFMKILFILCIKYALQIGINPPVICRQHKNCVYYYVRIVWVCKFNEKFTETDANTFHEKVKKRKRWLERTHNVNLVVFNLSNRLDFVQPTTKYGAYSVVLSQTHTVRYSNTYLNESYVHKEWLNAEKGKRANYYIYKYAMA